jgi:Na+/proline symporter
MGGLHVADIAVLGLYLLGVAGIGVWSSRRIKGSADFFLPRRFGKLMMVMFSFGTGTHSDQAVGVASKSYSSGLSGIWYQWLWLPVTPFYWLIAPVMRRCRAITTANVFEARYDRSVGMLFAVVGMANLSVTIGLMLRGSSEVIAASTGGLLSAEWAIAAMTVIFVFYGIAGGLAAAIVTDFIQGILTIIFSFLLLPLILSAVGGMSGLRAGLADPAKLSLVAPQEIGLFYIAVIALNGLVGIAVQPHTMANCGAGRTELEGRVGFMFGNLTKRLCTIPWCLTGLAAVVYFARAGRSVEPDQVFGTVAGDFLPRIVPGVLGLFIAALLASVMSSCDAFMIASSALFTENLYRPFVRVKGPEHFVRVGRMAAAGVVGIGVGFAYWLPGVVAGLEIFWKISAMMGLAFWLGLFWRRATVAGAWAATLVSFTAWFLTGRFALAGRVVWDFNASVTPHLPAFMVWEQKLYLPWQMVFYLSAGLMAGVFVSWLTKPVAAEKAERFYALLRTPVRAGERVETACTLPSDAVVPARRNLFGHSDLEVPIPTRTGIVGFLVGWGCVALIVAAAYVITKM